jgi:FkbM family methyltransferase
MSFLSYAQNFEDVMLWRALGHIPEGMYIDIGAQHPRIDSISRSFYEHGWRGIHVEPVPAFADLVRADRPDEAVLQIALGNAEGTLELNVIADTGLSTAVDSYAERHKEERGYAIEQIRVSLSTMRSAFAYLAGRDVHWLKIDVEGFELQVLEGWDSEVLRPWVMVVEATIPNSPQTDFETWDPILLAARYQFVYFDGLNRFYVANEHPELVAAFSCPPNVFDATELSGLASWGLCRPAIASRDALQAQLAVAIDAAETERATMQEALGHSIAESAHWQATAETNHRDNVILTGQMAQMYKEHGAVAGELTFLRARTADLELAVKNSENLQARHDNLAFEYQSALVRIDELSQQAHRWWTTAMAFEAQVKAMLASRSWRLTAPVRSLLPRARHSRALPFRALRWAWRQVRKASAAPAPYNPMVLQPRAPASQNAPVLSPREALVYRDLQNALEKSKD